MVLNDKTNCKTVSTSGESKYNGRLAKKHCPILTFNKRNPCNQLTRIAQKILTVNNKIKNQNNWRSSMIQTRP